MLPNSHVRRASKHHPLAACIAGMFALSSPLASWAASTWTVTDCTDDPSSGYAANQIGSLRFVVMHAASGDTIDLKHLPLNCSTISLQNGAIAISQDDLTLNGPGRDALTITGKNSPKPDRIFTHTGAGTLYLRNLSVSYGYFNNPDPFPAYARGGCIYSAFQGSVVLNDVSVDHCKASADSGNSRGGGIYTKGSLTLLNSTVSSNTSSGMAPSAGGVFSRGSFVAKYSTISENSITHANGSSAVSYGAGLRCQDDVTLSNSTISDNISDHSTDGGGIFVIGTGANTTSIINSTVSGNMSQSAGGLLLRTGTIVIQNSTIAFNSTSASLYAAGIEIEPLGSSVAVTFESTLVSNNLRNGLEMDLGASLDSVYPVTFSGSNNLIVSSTAMLPGDTITDAPLLGPLQFNGGPTRTHALLPGSPGIGKGNNSANRSHDQRGLGYPRSTSTGTTDIGAFEFDAIFWSGLE